MDYKGCERYGNMVEHWAVYSPRWRFFQLLANRATSYPPTPGKLLISEREDRLGDALVAHCLPSNSGWTPSGERENAL